MSRRVVVTGMGAITPLGLSVEEFWNGVKEGKIGFGPITKFDAEGYKASLSAEVKGFDAKNYMDFKAAKHSASMRWLPQKRRWRIPDWIWKRKIPGAWALR